MTKKEEQEKLDYIRKHDSHTSPHIEDTDFDEKDGTYFWDCWNADYCAKFRKRFFKYSCLKGHTAPRCSREEKIKIRQEALIKGFYFPNDEK